jgi:hypothetical protein
MHKKRRRNTKSLAKAQNLGPLGWVGVGVGTVAVVGVVLAGVVFYRLTRL